MVPEAEESTGPCTKDGAATIAHLRVRVEVTMTDAGLLRRAPDPGGDAFWVTKGDAGTSIQRLISMFYASGEHRGRFA